jgi:hypothetical protein
LICRRHSPGKPLWQWVQGNLASVDDQGIKLAMIGFTHTPFREADKPTSHHPVNRKEPAFFRSPPLLLPGQPLRRVNSPPPGLTSPSQFGTRVACIAYSEEFMKTKKRTSFTSAAIALATGLAMLAAPNKIEAQQTTNDRFDITLPYPVTIGSKVLQPGNYSVEPLTITGGDAPVLLISGERGLKVKTSVMVAPTVENRIQPETHVTLHHIGQRYYFDKIWVKGVAYGYHFRLPKGVKGPATDVQ